MMGTVSWTRGHGPLMPFADGFRRHLIGLGYPPGSAKHQLDLMGQLDHWLTAEDLAVGEVTQQICAQFLAARRVGGQRRVPTLVSLAPLVDYLTAQGVSAAEPVRRRRTVMCCWPAITITS